MRSIVPVCAMSVHHYHHNPFTTEHPRHGSTTPGHMGHTLQKKQMISFNVCDLENATQKMSGRSITPPHQLQFHLHTSPPPQSKY